MRDSYGETLDDDTLAFIVDPVRAVQDSMNFYFQPVSWAVGARRPGDLPEERCTTGRCRPPCRTR